MRFGIIGAGMAGVLSAIKLTEAGFTDIQSHPLYVYHNFLTGKVV